MARIRSIKPETWTSEQVMDLSRDARLLFIGMWNFCDDAGIHPASPKRLKAEVFPGDDITSADVRRLIDEAISVGLVEEYEIDGESFWIVTGWHHQKIDQPTYKYPRPDGMVPDGAAKRRASRIKPADSAITKRTHGDGSPNDPRTLGERSPPEGKGREGKGKEEDSGIAVVSVNPAKNIDDEKPEVVPKDAAEWSRYFRDKHGVELNANNVHHRTKAWPLFSAWTNAGVTVRQMDAAVAQAQLEAREPIAFLPAYVDRVIASMLKPERLSPEAQRRAISDANERAFLEGDLSADPNTIEMES